MHIHLEQSARKYKSARVSKFEPIHFPKFEALGFVLSRTMFKIYKHLCYFSKFCFSEEKLPEDAVTWNVVINVQLKILF